MFGVSFWELAVVGVIALIVLGPHQLPKICNMVGRWTRYFRNTWSAIAAEMDQQIQSELTDKHQKNERNSADH